MICVNLRSRQALALLLLVCVSIAGCQSARAPVVSEPVHEDAFAQGARRPPSPETLYRMGRLLESQGKDDQAVAVYMNTLDRYPNYLPAYCGLAELQLRQRKLAAARGTLQKALALAPNDAVIINNLGMCSLLADEYAAALEHFTRAASLAPDDARFRANMALATGLLGRYEEALALYSQIMPADRATHNVTVIVESRSDTASEEELERAAALGLISNHEKK